jgi:hypothetical protein
LNSSERQQHPRQQHRQREPGGAAAGPGHGFQAGLSNRQVVGQTDVDLADHRAQGGPQVAEQAAPVAVKPSILDRRGQRPPHLLRLAPGGRRADVRRLDHQIAPPRAHARQHQPHALVADPRPAGQLPDRYALLGDVLHAVRPHHHRHQPGAAATARARRRAVSRGAMRHLELKFVVELDREGDQHLREQGG